MTSIMSPETYAYMNKDKSYQELLKIRDELLEKIHEYEKDPNRESDFGILGFSPSDHYVYNLEVLPKICELIAEKYRQQEESRLK